MCLQVLNACCYAWADRVGDLLQTAMHFWGLTCAYYYMCTLPAPQELGWGQVGHLLQAAVHNGLVDGFGDLSSLPAAQGMGVDQVGELLQAALHRGQGSVVWYLSDLPAAQQLRVDQLGDLRRLAVERGVGLWRLEKLPEAHHP
jgi:hypothetical protein